MNRQRIRKDVVIVGGGPAGMLLGLVLARVGIDVMVLESKPNFDREYRGEVLQPRFLQLFDQLNLRDYVEQLPHSKIEEASIYQGDKKIGGFPFTSISNEVPYALWIPQTILLQALYDKAKGFSHFSMMFHAPVKSLCKQDNQITGVVVETEQHDEIEIEAKVTVGADGRFSTIRRLGEFDLEYENYPGDVIWFTMKRPKNEESRLQLKLTEKYNFIILPKYPDLLQVGIAMPRGEWNQIQQRGLEDFRRELQQSDPFLEPFAQTVSGFRSFVPLQAKTQLVREWARDGCLLIGDAAHCSSPVGAIGVSLAVTTSVIAADVIYEALQNEDVSAKVLSKVQKRRIREIRTIHQIQDRVGSVFLATSPFIRKYSPYILKVATRTPIAPKTIGKMTTLPKDIIVNPRFIFD